MILLFNILIIAMTMLLGYILPINVVKLKYRIANRFYPGKISIFKILWSLAVFFIYFKFLNYIQFVLLKYFEIEQFKIYPGSIVNFYLLPALFIIWLILVKYGNIKVIYRKPKPDKSQLYDEIIGYSTDTLKLNEKAILIGLCKHYLKHYKEDKDILNVMTVAMDKKLKTIININIILSSLVWFVLSYLIEINILLSFMLTILILRAIFTLTRLYGGEWGSNTIKRSNNSKDKG